MSRVPSLHIACRCADTRESKKFSVPTSIKHDVFHDEPKGKFSRVMLFHFSRLFFTVDGRPENYLINTKLIINTFSNQGGLLLISPDLQSNTVKVYRIDDLVF